MVLLELRRALMERIDASLVRANKLIRLLQVRRGEVHKFHEGGTSISTKGASTGHRMRVDPLPAVGALITDVSISELSTGQFEALVPLLQTHGVLVFRKPLGRHSRRLASLRTHAPRCRPRSRTLQSVRKGRSIVSSGAPNGACTWNPEWT